MPQPIWAEHTAMATAMEQKNKNYFSQKVNGSTTQLK